MEIASQVKEPTTGLAVPEEVYVGEGMSQYKVCAYSLGSPNVTMDKSDPSEPCKCVFDDEYLNALNTDRY
jgi:hypothetical protein